MSRRYKVVPLYEYNDVYQVELWEDGDLVTVVLQDTREACETYAFTENAYLIEAMMYD